MVRVTGSEYNLDEMMYDMKDFLRTLHGDPYDVGEDDESQ